MELTNKVVREKNLTTIMVTHNLRFAVEYGDRLLMMHQGHAVIDKAGAEKDATTIDHILKIPQSSASVYSVPSIAVSTDWEEAASVTTDLTVT